MINNPNIMAENSGSRAELTDEQADIIRRSLLVRLVPGDVESPGAPGLDRMPVDLGEYLDQQLAAPAP